MKIAGREQLKRKILALPAAVRAELMAALRTSGHEINALQRQFVPKEDGVLASTIGMIENAGELKMH